jgi:hypothetical protein
VVEDPGHALLQQPGRLLVSGFISTMGIRHRSAVENVIGWEEVRDECGRDLVTVPARERLDV